MKRSENSLPIRSVVDDNLQRHRQRAGEIAVGLCKEHPDWTWDKIASEARRQAGLRPLQAWERG
jgi:hypothetical protein